MVGEAKVAQKCLLLCRVYSPCPSDRRRGKKTVIWMFLGRRCSPTSKQFNFSQTVSFVPVDKKKKGVSFLTQANWNSVYKLPPPHWYQLRGGSVLTHRSHSPLGVLGRFPNMFLDEGGNKCPQPGTLVLQTQNFCGLALLLVKFNKGDAKLFF